MGDLIHSLEVMGALEGIELFFLVLINIIIYFVMSAMLKENCDTRLYNRGWALFFIAVLALIIKLGFITAKYKDTGFEAW